MNPENDGSGVVIIGGKLNTNAPTEGVTGTRVLLGTVTFTHSGVTDFSGVTLTYGRGDGTGDYKNFVGTNGTVLDGAKVDLSNVIIAKRGDANADGIINNVDMGVVRNIILGRIPGVKYRCYADADANGSVTNVDMGVIRNIILGN
jgi:hypothetical protein